MKGHALVVTHVDESKKWIIDSRASYHMAGSLDKFSSVKHTSIMNILMANGVYPLKFTHSLFLF